MFGRPQKEHVALFYISLGWFLILSGRYSISALLPQITQGLAFSYTQAGAAMTGMWVLYAASQFPAGIYSDIKGRKKIITLAMAGFAVAYLVLGLSIHYLMFLLALVLLGVGSGSCPAAGISMITDMFKKERGRALGVRSSAGSLAYGVPVLATAIAGLYGWRIFFYIWAALSGVSVYLFWKRTVESTSLPDRVSIRERIMDGIAVFRQREVQLLFVVNLLVAVAWIGYMSFFPAYLQEAKSFTPLYASISLAIVGGGGFIFKPLAGTLSDMYDNRLIMMTLAVFTCLGTVAVVYASTVWLVFLISPVLALAPAIFPVISSSLMNRWESKGRAGKMGFFRSSFLLLASPTAASIGFLGDRYGFDVPFLGIAGILFTAFLVLAVSMTVAGARGRLVKHMEE